MALRKVEFWVVMSEMGLLNDFGVTEMLDWC